GAAVGHFRQEGKKGHRRPGQGFPTKGGRRMKSLARDQETRSSGDPFSSGSEPTPYPEVPTPLDRREGLLHVLTLVLRSGLSREESSRRIVEAAAKALGWDAGAVWSLDASAGVLRCQATWLAAPSRAPGLAEMNRRRSFPMGLGFPGRVWASGAISW